MLRRSDQSTIALTSFFTPLEGLEIFAHILPRLRAFAGSFRTETWKIMIKEAQRPGSELRSLILDSIRETDDFSIVDSRTDQTQALVLPLKHLAVHSPHRIPIESLNLSLFSNLSSLSLSWKQCHASALLNGLMGMSGLTELILKNACQDAPSDLDVVVSLPNLTYLELIDRNVPKLMSHLRLPIACVIHWTCTIVSSYETLLPLLSAPQFTKAGDDSVGLSVGRRHVGFSNVPIGFQHISKVNKRHSSMTIAISWHQTMTDSMQSLYECVPRLFARYSLFSSLTSLQLCALGYRAAEPLPFSFSIFKNITTLFVAPKTLGWLLSIKGGILFPSLKRFGLIIDKEVFRFDELVVYLTMRWALTAGIHALELRYHSISNSESLNSHMTTAQRNKVQSLAIILDLFYIVDGLYLVETAFMPVHAESPQSDIYQLQLKPLCDCR